MRNHLLYLVVCFSTIPAFADVATTAYVDSMRATVQSEIDGLVNKDGFEPNLVLQTDSNGNVTAGLVTTNMIADGAIQTMHIADGEITDADLAAGLGLDKLDWGTLPTDGRNYIPIWNSATNEYVFELYDYDGLLCDDSEYDIGVNRCISKNIVPDAGGGWDFIGNIVDYCATCKVRGDWEVRYTSGAHAGTTLTGKTLCSSTGGTVGVAGKPNETQGSGTNCWCRFSNNGMVSPWVLCRNGIGSVTNCTGACARACSGDFRWNATFRSGMLNAVSKK